MIGTDQASCHRGPTPSDTSDDRRAVRHRTSFTSKTEEASRHILPLGVPVDLRYLKRLVTTSRIGHSALLEPTDHGKVACVMWMFNEDAVRSVKTPCR